VPAVDNETRHPPDSGVILSKHSGQSPVAAYSWKSRAESHSGPSDWMITDIGDEPRRYSTMKDLRHANRTP
jgi:hypothetical protein